MGRDHDDLMALLLTVPGVKEHLEEYRIDRVAALAKLHKRLERVENDLDSTIPWRDIRRE